MTGSPSELGRILRLAEKDLASTLNQWPRPSLAELRQTAYAIGVQTELAIAQWTVAAAARVERDMSAKLGFRRHDRPPRPTLPPNELVRRGGEVRRQRQQVAPGVNVKPPPSSPRPDPPQGQRAKS